MAGTMESRRETREQLRRMLFEACPTINVSKVSIMGVAKAPSREPPRCRSDTDRAEIIWIGFVQAGFH